MFMLSSASSIYFACVLFLLRLMHPLNLVRPQPPVPQPADAVLPDVVARKGGEGVRMPTPLLDAPAAAASCGG
jgi:hypothetical protein